MSDILSGARKLPGNISVLSVLLHAQVDTVARDGNNIVDSLIQFHNIWSSFPVSAESQANKDQYLKWGDLGGQEWRSIIPEAVLVRIASSLV